MHTSCTSRTCIRPARVAGVDILHDPLWNKGTAFSMPERDRLNLRGLLPPIVRDLDMQIERAIGKLVHLHEPNPHYFVSF